MKRVLGSTIGHHIPDEQDDEIDLNDISSFEMFITDWV